MCAVLAAFILRFSLQPKKLAGHSVCEVDCNLLQATFSFISFKSLVSFSSTSKSFSEYFESEQRGEDGCMTGRILGLGKLSIPDPPVLF